MGLLAVVSEGYFLLLLTAVISLVVEHGLWGLGSEAAAHRLHCPGARALFPDRGSNPCPLHWQADSGPPGKAKKN